MKFCPKCGMMLSVVIEGDRKWLSCNRCGYRETLKDHLVIREDLNEDKYRTSQGVVQGSKEIIEEEAEDARRAIVDGLEREEFEGEESSES